MGARWSFSRRPRGVDISKLNSGGNDSAIQSTDVNLSKSQVQTALQAAGKIHWSARILEGPEAKHGSGSEIYSNLNGAEGVVSAKLLSSWWYFEDAFDGTCGVFQNAFGEFKVREQQISKVRYDIFSTTPDGIPRKMSSMFALMEEQKAALHIQEYSISQTSLEQIFNQFASTQEEEDGRPLAGNLSRDNDATSSDINMSRGGVNANARRGYKEASSDDTAVEIHDAASTSNIAQISV